MGRVINPAGVRIFAVCAVAVVFLIGANVFAAKVQIPEGTKISVKFPATMKISSGKISAGIPLAFELARPIEIGGKVIVEKGARGTAVVKESVKARRGGKPGKITVEFTELMPTGNFKSAESAGIKLKGSVTAQGKGKKTLSYLFIFGLFIKGGQGEIPTDKYYEASVAESIILEDQ